MRAFLIRLPALAALLATLPTLAQDAVTWRRVDAQNLVYMDLPAGEVVIELNPRFAPATVARFKELIGEDFYRGLSFYRVIEGFVAQAGDESDISQPGARPGIEAEFEREIGEDWPWTRAQKDDLFAPETGFVDGFAAGRDGDRVWLAHCPGVVAMARGVEADSSSTDFYIVIGQAPRYLDRNMNVFGRVIDGMDVVQSVERGSIEFNGIIQDDLSRTRILGTRMAGDLEPGEGGVYYVMDTNSDGFRDMMKRRRERRDDFFHHRPPPVLDVCQVPVHSRRERSAVGDAVTR